MEAIRELFGINMTTFGLTIEMGWMALWPVLVAEFLIHLRFFKSFGRKK